MKPTEILAMVAAGDIPDQDIERSKELSVVGFDEELEAGFLGFKDGTVLKVEPIRYNYMIVLAGIMNPVGPIFNVGGEFGPESSVLRVVQHIQVSNLKNSQNQMIRKNRQEGSS